MQRIALDVADELVHGQGIGRAFCGRRIAPAQVDLVQVARAVVQVVQRPLGVLLTGQGGQHGLGAVAQGVMAVVQRVALAGDFIDRHLLHQIAQQIVGKAGGVKGFEGPIGLTSACFPGFLLWF